MARGYKQSQGGAGVTHRRIEMMVALLLPVSTGELRLLPWTHRPS